MNNNITLTIDYHLGYFCPKDVMGYSLVIKEDSVTLRTYYDELYIFKENLFQVANKTKNGEFYIDQKKPYKGIPFENLIHEFTYAFGVLPEEICDAGGTTFKINAFGNQIETYMPLILMENGLYSLTKELVKLLKDIKLPPFLSGVRSNRYKKENDIKNSAESTRIARMITRKLENYECIYYAKNKLQEINDEEKINEVKNYIDFHKEDNKMCDEEIEAAKLEIFKKKREKYLFNK